MTSSTAGTSPSISGRAGSWRRSARRRVPPLARVVGDLQFAELKKQEQQASYEGESAQRRLAHILVEASFYLPRELMSHGEYRRAATCYGLAATIRPEAPSPQWGLARAHARLGSKREAPRPWRAPSTTASTTYPHRVRTGLVSIRTDPGYPAVLDRLPKSNKPPRQGSADCWSRATVAIVAGLRPRPGWTGTCRREATACPRGGGDTRLAPRHGGGEPRRGPACRATGGCAPSASRAGER